MKLTRSEIIQELDRLGIFPAKYGYRYVIARVREYEAWWERRAA